MSKRLAALFLTLSMLFFSGQFAHGDWTRIDFNGQEFREAVIGKYPLFRQRQGFLPFIDYSGTRQDEVRLQEGSGALAGICYIQSAGGKAHAVNGFIPMAGEPVEIRNGKTLFTVRSDASGYFVLALPAGTYELKVRGITRKVTVEKGKSLFVPMRGGKRMVD